jgi:crotonobetainyl-CoA:carnitine CoA-transferase CaiB-like acyl-CoA transferase
MFAGLCRATGRLDWLDDARLRNAQLRFEHAAEINGVLERTFQTQNTDHWLRMLRENGVVCGSVNDYETFLQDEQVLHAGIFRQVRQFMDRPVPVPRVPGSPSDAALQPAPHAGQDTDAVLADVGYSQAEIAALRESGAVGARLAECTRP